MQRLPAFPDLPQHVMRVDLAGRRYTYRRTYRPRTRAWYVDIYDDQGKVIVEGQRLTPGVPLSTSFEVDLPGVIYVRGPDDYRREDLGGDLREIFATFDELGLEAAADAEDDFIVSVEETP